MSKIEKLVGMYSECGRNFGRGVVGIWVGTSVGVQDMCLNRIPTTVRAAPDQIFRPSPDFF